MIRIVHFADVHLGMENYGKIDPASGLSSRFADFLNSFDRIVNYSIDKKHQVDLVLFSGDAYKTRDPSPTYMRAFAERIKKIADANIPVVLLVGNHDLPTAQGKANTLDIFATLDVPGVYVARKPQIIKINTGEGVVQVAALPWMSKSQLLDERGINKKSIRDSNKYVTEKLGKQILELNNKIDAHLPSILAAHFSVAGAQYSSEQAVMLGGDVAISLADLKKTKFNYIALGHLHKHQILLTKPLVIFPGSIERVDFGERKEPKGFVVLDISRRNAKFKTSYQFVKLPARRFVKIKIDLPRNKKDPTGFIINKISQEDIKEAVVKLDISLFADQEEILEESKIKENLKDVFIIAGISKKIIDTMQKKSLDFIEEKIGPRQLIEKYLEQKDYSKSKKEKLLTFADELMAETEL